jgi:PhoPQ-activated pathogenicity-related protein
MNERSRLFRLCGFVASVLGGSIARADLGDYVKRPDAPFAWKVEERRSLPGGTAYSLKLTSQVWQGSPWEHWLVIYEPAELTYRDTMLLFVTGGSQSSRPEPDDDIQGFSLAKLCGARCAVLHQVPNQPLLGGRSEDDLIAETFVRYLDNREEDVPLLFPMVKSAVRAMDAAQAWAKQAGKGPVNSFVVSGASKRGWTTWLTAAVDPRVVAIAPMVIVTLNMRAQNPHQLKVWGKYSEQIEDYTRRGLMDRLETPDGLKLWAMIDPYTYRDRLTMPKLLINGSNDRYWAHDALNLFWDDLKGPKYVVFVPNAGHGLEQNREYATHGIGALFRTTASHRKLPILQWMHSERAGKLHLDVSASPAPKSAQLWVAESDNSDFRESTWKPSPMFHSGDAYSGEALIPKQGAVAVFGDFEYAIDGLMYHLSTEIYWAGAASQEPGRE